MKTLDSLVNKIKNTPQSIEFNDVINVIGEHYVYTPTLFRNGIETDCVINQAQENEGSCKIFAFAQLHQLSEIQTLHCFGQYYREEVLDHPDETNHANIRTFMKYGWDHIHFDGVALIAKL
jgi:hypothetical protein